MQYRPCRCEGVVGTSFGVIEQGISHEKISSRKGRQINLLHRFVAKKICRKIDKDRISNHHFRIQG
jgi:hypothetical protein